MNKKLEIKDISPTEVSSAKLFNPSQDIAAKTARAQNKSAHQQDLYQAREKIYRKLVSGTFQRIREVTIWLTLSVYFLGPWLTWNGRQALLFDLPERKFYIFGFTFWPQDFVLLSWLLIISAFTLFFVTALAGRVYCGYACPQTVWTHVFVWIEKFTEGDRNKRIKLDAQELTANKFLRKSLKHCLWLIVAFATAFTFVGYFQPIKELTLDVLYIEVHGWALFWLGFFTLATYGNAGWMREQVCMYMCPYARFQSAMFDKDTLIVTYDEKRGEPRGKRKKSEDIKASGKGDCINCQLCVQVCPTGIDIRNGLQYECITCAACIDACDMMMDQVGYDRGLIRYSTEHAMEGGKTHILRPRLIGYGLFLLVMMSAFSYVFLTRVPLELDIIRDRNQLYRETSTGLIENTYTLKIMNMTQSENHYVITMNGVEGLDLNAPDTIRALPGELVVVPVSAALAPEDIEKPNTTVTFSVESTVYPGQRVVQESRFIAPLKL
ncbi:MAG: cytochrome c oxidase accessory protein CcoG [Pseudomonadales bacterium]|nr:cytochrome c oxidase accessory protein CcoG [Pseudomonadales bacterium]